MHYIPQGTKVYSFVIIQLDIPLKRPLDKNLVEKLGIESDLHTSLKFGPTKQQELYLEGHIKLTLQSATTAEQTPKDDPLKSLPRIDSVKKSVFMIWGFYALDKMEKEDGTVADVKNDAAGTGFIADVPGCGMAMLSAGHNFLCILDNDQEQRDSNLENYIVQFGNLDGKWIKNDDTSVISYTPKLALGYVVNGTLRHMNSFLAYWDENVVTYLMYLYGGILLCGICYFGMMHVMVWIGAGLLVLSWTVVEKKETILEYIESFCGTEPVKLKLLLEKLNVNGSIRKGEKRILLQNGKIVDFEDGIIENSKEDYCALLIDNRNNILRRFGIGGLPLKCGEDKYLNIADGKLVAMFGYPECNDFDNDMGRVRPLRVSWGTEKEQTSLNEDNYLYYDVDTVGGNSGSPVIGRGLEEKDRNQGYCIKGIHIGDATNIKKINVAQNIRKLKEWIELGKNFKEKGPISK